jgi:hypothetical protein
MIELRSPLGWLYALLLRRSWRLRIALVWRPQGPQAAPEALLEVAASTIDTATISRNVQDFLSETFSD